MDDGRSAGAVLSEIRTVAETGSTNADVLALAADGAEEGLWLRAERQTAGRGRQGRGWSSPTGNLYASTLVRVRPGDPSPASLALVCAVALSETIAALGCPAVQIKWPNDLLLDGAKLSGILLERSGDAIVAGFGVNLASHPSIEGRQTASLAGRLWIHSAAELYEHLVVDFARWLAIWRAEGLEPVVARWQQQAHPPGTPLLARLSDGSSVSGSYDGLTSDGALRLRLADGDTRVIHAGDVFLV
ncbi:biotin--[acetyl-CoA-carboxylase] ligase [Sphingomonas jeddahensis]|uniref:biotin--[biotin carboxyl-carrier protein] ligase n=1 Tax=Sphingomonas jeddahensis TaxID=1915074 RepID=A0A1V2EVK6_9SPHN|nr:biotin--[acetyl-CoA-carboxylase] ligase [Sphingomonas jeddahensis]ONF96716.1 Bifunctional ligase/repressor BirA [Sphingomonas jeddahensis]